MEPESLLENLSKENVKSRISENDFKDINILELSFKDRCILSGVLLTSILRDLENNEYTKLRITASWNPTQTVEVEPPPEKETERESDVEPI